MKIAIIGAGISGLTTAYYLKQHHQVSVFEVADKIGGHTATVDVRHQGRDYAIDTGFIVFNDWTYPNFIELMDELGVDSQPTEMSFSVRCESTGIEYGGNNLNAMFAQRRNLLRPSFHKMIRDILKLIARPFVTSIAAISLKRLHWANTCVRTSTAKHSYTSTYYRWVVRSGRRQPIE